MGRPHASDDIRGADLNRALGGRRDEETWERYRLAR